MAIYPLRHLSIRVPWHDNRWDGTVCVNPKFNGSCLKLPRIAEERDDEIEKQIAGKSLEDLSEDRWPCCVTERMSFMAPFEFTRTARHPYTETSSETHGHFAPTPLRHPPYSAPAVPFRWMLKDNLEILTDQYDLDADPEREPELKFKSSWVQQLNNQKALLDCFFGHVRPASSSMWTPGE